AGRSAGEPGGSNANQSRGSAAMKRPKGVSKMATAAHSQAVGGSTNGAARELEEWRTHARVFLQPIAAPSILGLFGFSAATFIVTAHLVGWYGTAKSPTLIFPFAAAAGGVAQGAA